MGFFRFLFKTLIINYELRSIHYSPCTLGAVDDAPGWATPPSAARTAVRQARQRQATSQTEFQVRL